MPASRGMNSEGLAFKHPVPCNAAVWSSTGSSLAGIAAKPVLSEVTLD